MKQRTSLIETALGQRNGMQNPEQEGGPAGQPPFPGAQPENYPMQGGMGNMQAQPDPNKSNGMSRGPGFGDIRDAIVELIQSGKLDSDFDLQEACTDKEFAKLLAEMPVEAAARVYQAEKRIKDVEANAMERMTAQVKSRNALPRSTRGGAMSAPAVNYHDMDSGAFRKLLGDIKKTTRDGGKVRL